MNEESKILAGRYQVGSLIGRGGMAEVHIGYDTRLGRTVAIKILRPDLARDPSFQTRFRREAQAAAGLNHPAIVAVYDTGEDRIASPDGTSQTVPFIVMEYVEGNTVREILKGDVAAPIDEAVEIVSGVLTALDYSHRAGLVHRDIKPGNVMLTPTGAVKVMDFGIARALADAGQTMTQTQAVVGTAQYLSPEQARGESVDARSDLYSTGCVLFELLTGRPPFIGESPVSVAYQHVREMPARPSQFASDVPPQLDQIVLRALAKNRDDRYSSAQEFLADLRAVMHGTPLNPITAAVPLNGIAAGVAGGLGGAAGATAAAAQQNASGEQPISGQFDPAITEAPTQVMPGIDAPGSFQPAGVQPTTGQTQIVPPPASVGATGPSWNTVVGGSIEPAASAATTTLEVDPDEGDPDARRKKIMQWGIIGASALFVIALVFLIMQLTKSDGPAPEPSPSGFPVPSIEDLTEAEARELLEGLDLIVTVTPEASDEVEVGTAIRTDPAEGEEVLANSRITLYVSSGSDVVLIPDVAGRSEQEARDLLEKADLRVTIERVNGPEQEAGYATNTDPAADQEVARGAMVTLYISTGMVQLPNLSGMDEQTVRSQLTALSLTPNITYIETADYPAGTVIKQEPGPGEVKRNQVVNIEIAKAKTTTTVPRVINEREADARTMLANAKLQVSVNYIATTDQSQDGRVRSQGVAANSVVNIDTQITIDVWKYEAPAPPDPGTEE